MNIIKLEDPETSNMSQNESKEFFPLGETLHDEGLKTTKTTRHCAFCLQDGEFKLCSGCCRRAYCSRKCQVADWSPSGTGQRHKNWCKYECGEEDIDFQVVSVPGKGLGIVARRVIPTKYRIIVEPVYTSPSDHPAINDLEPANASLQEKFNLNYFSCDFDKSYVALRICRVNHDCNPNAGLKYCSTSRVQILYSYRQIEIGEEITISYKSFSNVESGKRLGRDPELEFLAIKKSLKTKWDIVCPPDCVCNDPAVKQLVLKGRQLTADIHHQTANRQSSAALLSLNQLLEIQELIHSPWLDIAKNHYTAFQMAIMTMKTLNQAPEHIRIVHEIFSAVCPHSLDTLKSEREMKNPKCNLNYLCLERLKRNQ